MPTMHIDESFRSLIPPLSADEANQLEANIVANGCRDPLVVWAETGILLDGHHRAEICERRGLPYKTVELSFAFSLAAAKDWVDANQLGRRNLSPDAAALLRGRRYNRMKRQGARTDLDADTSGKTCQKSTSAEQLAEKHGVSEKTIRNDGAFAAAVEARKAVEPDIEQRVLAGEVKRSELVRTVKQDVEAATLLAAQAEVSSEAKANLSAVCDLRVCSMRDLLTSGVTPEAIITDPPYPREFLPLYGELAELSKTVPLVAVMCGQSYLPEIMAAMCAHLRYRWTLAYLTPGGQAVQQWQAKVNCSWKPVLLFGEASEEWLGDVARSAVNDNDKRFHGWGQSESGMADLIDRLTKPGSLVCDPFLGGGTTAVACLRLGRRFVGCDLDAAAVDTSRQRCEAICDAL